MRYSARLVLLIATVVAVGAQPQGSGVISGTVVQQASGEPVRKAIVSLFWYGRPKSWAAVMTDASGRFSFDSLPAGSYELTAERQGVGAATYGAQGPSRLGAYLKLGEGEIRNNVVLRLVRPASLSGTVFDGDGDPLAGAEVVLMAEDYPRGTRELVERYTVQTDDRGEYRIPDVSPGRYFLVAGHSAGSLIWPLPGQPRGVYPRQFYGGVSEWKNAAPLTVASGEQMTGLDFRLNLTHPVTVRGRVTGIPESQTGFVQVQFTSLAETGQRTGTMSSGTGPPEYRFRVPDVLPGRYQVTGTMTVGKKSFWALQTFEIREDSGEISLALAPATDLKGDVRAEGDGPDLPKEFEVRLTRGDARSGLAPITAHTGPDGRFTLEQVPPGVWDIGVEPVPKGGYLKSMHLGKQDVLTEDMEIGPGTNSPLRIVVSSRGARVKGQVGSASRAVLVVLAPVGKYRNVMSFLSAVTSEADGTFAFLGISPGEYKIFGLEELPAGGITNPDLFARLDAWGEPVQITEGAVVEAKTRLIPADRLREALR